MSRDRISETCLAVGAALALGGLGGCASDDALTATDSHWVDTPGAAGDRPEGAPPVVRLGSGDAYGDLVYASYLAHLEHLEEDRAQREMMAEVPVE